MATSQSSEVIQHLRGAVFLREGAGLTDRQLLEDYLSRREEAALAALVYRHGPMVWGVCRRVLGNYHDAEDAFQATFLVLVRKASSIAVPELLANWLYGVALQTALKARATTAKRRSRERQVMEMPEPAVTEQDLWNDLQPLLDQDLSRLPDKYRVAIVLCDLEGKTRKEAARQLGVPEGTLAARLARGRVMLAKRLARHGLAVSGGSLAAVLSQNAVSASAPISVVVSTIKATGLFAAGHAAAESVISVKVAALTDGVVRTLFLTKLKIATAVLVSAAFLASGFSAVLIPALQARATDGSALVRLGHDEVPHQPPAKTDKEMLQGTWRLVETHKHGKQVDAKDIPISPHRLLIDGSKIETKLTKGVGDRGEFELNTAATPKEITITWLIQWRGIYKLDKDRLTICFNPDNGIRPDEFRTAADTGRVLFVYERAKQKEDQGPPEEAEKDSERPKKLARMPAPPPELQRELSAFDAYRHGSEERFVELERKADELLKKYTAPDDQARIYFEMAHVAAQSDIRNHVQRVRRFARKSLALSRDPLQRGVLHSYLGSAAEVEAEETFEDRRRQAATELLTGYAEMLAQELPAKAPELPVVNKLGAEGIDPDSVKAAQARARHAAQMAAREEAEFIRELVDRRDTLANQLRWLYHPDPKIHGRTSGGPAKLRALAGRVLKDPKAVEALLERVTEP
jgi:RNA polymerase sigma factor (sigma-70 family)